jgi:hypothetical protein
MGVLDTLQKNDNTEVYPKTVTAVIYDKDTNARLDNVLATCLKSIMGGASLNVWYGTQVQYNAIATKDANTLYFIEDIVTPL